MKYIIAFVFFATTLAHEGCKNTETKTETPQPAEQPSTVAAISETPDSSKIAAWTALSQQIEADVRGLKIEPFKPNVFSPEDAMGVVRKDGKFARITFGSYPQDKDCREYYYFDNNENFVYYRFLGWNKVEPSAKEVICYIDNGKIFHALERNVKLQPGQKPQPLLAEPQTISSMKPDSLYSAINGTLDKLKAVIAKGK